MAHIARIEHVIGRSSDPPARIDWAAIEGSVGLSFPVDYKDLAAAYHGLEVSDFLLVRHIPSIWASKQEQRVVEKILGYLGAITEGEEDIFVEDDDRAVSFETPFPYYPEAGGLYPWGSTANGDTCLWVTAPDPSDWCIVVTNGNSWWRYRNGGVVDFLIDAISGSLTCPLLPDMSNNPALVNEVVGPDRNDEFVRRSLR